jgi:hypothetical protein
VEVGAHNSIYSLDLCFSFLTSFRALEEKKHYLTAWIADELKLKAFMINEFVLRRYKKKYISRGEGLWGKSTELFYFISSCLKFEINFLEDGLNFDSFSSEERTF